MGHNAYTTPWTPEMVEYLRKRAAERWTSGRISDGLRERFGLVVSYNAVVGKAVREGIILLAHTWPEEATVIFRKMAAEGHCAPAIAKALQKAGFAFTRRAVRNKSLTEKMPLAAFIQTKSVAREPTPSALISSRASMQQKINLREQRMAVAAELADHESDPLPSSRPVRLTELKGHQCKWPLRRNEDGDRMFCGAFKLGNTPYCTHHHDISYIKDERKLPSHGPQEIHVI